MARKADPTKMGGGGPPRLGWDDMEDDVVIVTIVKVEDGVFEDGADAGKPWVRLRVDEDEEEPVQYLNKTQMKHLIEGLGTDDMDKWEGREVPLEKTRTSFGGKEYKVVWVAPVEDWSEYGVKVGAPTTRAKRTKRAK